MAWCLLGLAAWPQDASAISFGALAVDAWSGHEGGLLSGSLRASWCSTLWAHVQDAMGGAWHTWEGWE
eukprot:1696046-Alexandrium_andersonii.AAC.1